MKPTPFHAIVAAALLAAPAPGQGSFATEAGPKRAAVVGETLESGIALHVLDTAVGAPWSAGPPRDVDDAGRVVGASLEEGVSTPFAWTALGGFQALAVPYEYFTRVNGLGDVLYPFGLVFRASGTWVVVSPPAGSAIQQVGDLNDGLAVVGSVVIGSTTTAFAWDPALGPRSIAVPNATGLDRINQGTLAVGNAQVAAGTSCGFVVDVVTGEYTLFAPLLPRGPKAWSVAVDVNDSGAVVGQGYDGSSSSAFVFTEENGFVFLPGLGGGSTDDVRPKAIDGKGRVVGQARTASGEWHAFVWDPAQGMRDLNALVESLVESNGDFVLRQADDLSETGVVIGWGSLNATPEAQTGFILSSI